MSNYKCCRCGYETIQKSDFRRHLMRNKICKNIINTINEAAFYEFYKNDFPEVISKINTIKETQTIISNQCKYCNKTLSSYKNKWKHEKYNCKMKKDMNKDKEIIELKKEIKELKELNKVSNMKKEITELKKEINMLKEIINKK